MTENDCFKELTSYLTEIAPEAKYTRMSPKDAIFEECVKMNCYYCSKYGLNWRCPPNLPKVDYEKVFSEFENGLLVYFNFSIPNMMQFEAIRMESSNRLHKTLLQLEKWLYENNRPTAISFGGGSCKLCKGGCGKERCNNPEKSRSPLEATGVNVVKTAKRHGIDIVFPPVEGGTLMRIGLLMWQNKYSENFNDRMVML